MKKIDCSKCPQMHHCCQEGVSMDLEEAKKILALGLSGELHHFEPDKDFASGYRVDSSHGTDPCTFLDSDGLCSIHKLDYQLKPTPCKEFPHDEKKKFSSDAKYLCLLFKQRMNKRRKN